VDTTEAVRRLRRDPAYDELLADSYLTGDPRADSRRFAVSDEWRATLELVGPVEGRRVADVGAGTGIASYAFATAGASVLAVEPDAGELGQEAIAAVADGLDISIVGAGGESLPIPDATVDLVYVRQTLHHARDLGQFLAECARVLRPGGTFFAAREHVVDDPGQLEAFLAAHPVHRLTGGEHAYPLHAYEAAIRAAGLRLERTIGPWDSVVNAFPMCRTTADLAALSWWERRRRKRRRNAGRLYAFLARRP
jgi:SAM-dependent methyltransferase